MSLIAADILAIGADVVTFGAAASVQLGTQPAQAPPQAQRNDCSECFAGRPHMHEGTSSDNAARSMYASDPAHRYSCGAVTGVGFVGARQNDGLLFLVNTAGHVIARTTRYGVTTFADTGMVSNAQPGSYSLLLRDLVAARQPIPAGPVPAQHDRAIQGGQHDPRRAVGNQGPQPQPDSRRARDLINVLRVHVWGNGSNGQ